jgi:enoyl-CoA hydratase/carnithine racemase
VRGAGSEFVLVCDMRFAARESAIFSQPEGAFGLIPGAGGIQHLTRLMGRARALEVMLSADDFDAELAERYGWINRALPATALGEFVRSLAHRIAGFPAVGRAALKDRVDAIALAPAGDFRRDSDLFVECARNSETQRRIRVAMMHGFQTRDGAGLFFSRGRHLTDSSDFGEGPITLLKILDRCPSPGRTRPNRTHRLPQRDRR